MTPSFIPGLVCGALLGVALAGNVTASQNAAPEQAPAGPGQGRGQMGMMAGRSQEMAAADKRLDDLVKAMQAATGTAKVDSLAAVVVELVAQHKAMHGRMARMGGPPAAEAAPGGDHPAAPDDSQHKH